MCCNNCSKHARAAGVCNKGLVQVWFSTAAIFTHHQQSMNLFRIWFFHVLFVALSLPCRALLSYPSLCLFALSTDLFLLHVPYSGGYFSFVLLLAGCVLPVEEYWKGGSQIRQIFLPSDLSHKLNDICFTFSPLFALSIVYLST